MKKPDLPYCPFCAPRFTPISETHLEMHMNLHHGLTIAQTDRVIEAVMAVPGWDTISPVELGRLTARLANEIKTGKKLPQQCPFCPGYPTLYDMASHVPEVHKIPVEKAAEIGHAALIASEEGDGDDINKTLLAALRHAQQEHNRSIQDLYEQP